MTIQERLEHQSVRRLTRSAVVLALIGLGTMAFSIVVPRPLPIILAMSIGQLIGILAFFFYLLAVIVDMLRSPPQDSLQPPPPDVGPPPR
jgi:hypothetical protein